MKRKTALRIVVASPGDVQSERRALADIVSEINHDVAYHRGLSLELARWETDTYPGFHPDGPQGLIDQLLSIEDFDVLIGIFWKRFGSPVKDANSGTEHEFYKAYRAWKTRGRPQIMFYFNQKAHTPLTQYEAEQWGKVIEFRHRFPEEGLWCEYRGKADFCRRVRSHLTQLVLGEHRPVAPTHRLNSKRWQTAKHKQLSDLMPRKIDRPGDLIPSDAHYYVERKEDQRVLDCLSEVHYAMLLAGPVQSGKSSLLKRLESKSRERGIETVWLYPVLPVGCSDKDVIEINASTASQFALTLKAEWNLDLPHKGVPQSIPDFLNWITVALAPTASRPRLLVIDDFAAIGALAVDQWITQFVRAFWNNRAYIKHQVSLAVGQSFYFNRHFETLLLHSSMVNWNVRFQPLHIKADPAIRWFDMDQVKKLRGNMDGSVSDKTADTAALFGLFKGQPYLTHAGIFDNAFLTAARNWSQEPNGKNASILRGTKPYQQHFKAIKRVLLGPSNEMDRYSRELIINFVRCDREKVESLEPRDKNFLLAAMLIDEKCQPRIPLYNLFAEDLKRLVHSKA